MTSVDSLLDLVPPLSDASVRLHEIGLEVSSIRRLRRAQALIDAYQQLMTSLAELYALGTWQYLVDEDGRPCTSLGQAASRVLGHPYCLRHNRYADFTGRSIPAPDITCSDGVLSFTVHAEWRGEAA